MRPIQNSTANSPYKYNSLYRPNRQRPNEIPIYRPLNATVNVLWTNSQEKNKSEPIIIPVTTEPPVESITYITSVPVVEENFDEQIVGTTEFFSNDNSIDDNNVNVESIYYDDNEELTTQKSPNFIGSGVRNPVPTTSSSVSISSSVEVNPTEISMVQFQRSNKYPVSWAKFSDRDKFKVDDRNGRQQFRQGNDNHRYGITRVSVISSTGPAKIALGPRLTFQK